MKRKPVFTYNIIYLPVLLLLTGCGYEFIKNDPQYVSPTFSFTDVQEIALSPIIDIRKGEREDYDPIERFSMIKLVLERMGYTPIPFSNTDEFRNITEEEIADSLPDWIRKRSPQGINYIFLLVLEDLVDRKNTFGSAEGAECFGRVIDSASGEVIWQHEAIGEFGMGGLTGMMMSAYTGDAAVGTCFSNVLIHIPPKTEKKWRRAPDGTPVLW